VAPRRAREVFGRGAVEAAPVPRTPESEAAALCHAYENLGLGFFWSTDAEGLITYLSTGAHALLVGNGDPVGRTFLDLFLKAGGEGERTLPFAFARKGRFEKLTVRSEREDGETLWWSVSGEAIMNQGEFGGFRGHCEDITGERLLAEGVRTSRCTIRSQVCLTGGACQYLLERTLTFCASQRSPCAIMLIDLDRFKQVNDTLGHASGDALLKQVATRLVRVVGDKEKVSRLGGDEFQIIMPGIDDRGALGELRHCNHNQHLAALIPLTAAAVLIGASVGVAISRLMAMIVIRSCATPTLRFMLPRATGRGRLRFFSADLLKAAADRRLLEEDLARCTAARRAFEFTTSRWCVRRITMLSGSRRWSAGTILTMGLFRPRGLFRLRKNPTLSRVSANGYCAAPAPKR